LNRGLRWRGRRGIRGSFRWGLSCCNWCSCLSWDLSRSLGRCHRRRSLSGRCWSRCHRRWSLSRGLGRGRLRWSLSRGLGRGHLRWSLSRGLGRGCLRWSLSGGLGRGRGSGWRRRSCCRCRSRAASTRTEGQGSASSVSAGVRLAVIARVLVGVSATVLQTRDRSASGRRDLHGGVEARAAGHILALF
jgi:hypothetical protein